MLALSPTSMSPTRVSTTIAGAVHAQKGAPQGWIGAHEGFDARSPAFLLSNGFSLEGAEEFLADLGHIVTIGIGEFDG
jgi:hypothetical protein